MNRPEWRVASSNILGDVSSSFPVLMGIVNVTPDSFSDVGRFLDEEKALIQGERLAASGALLIDVGGESSRPGSAPVSAEKELRRVLPVVQGLAAKGVLVSVDTYRPETAKAALSAGAVVINDITAGRGLGPSLSQKKQAASLSDESEMFKVVSENKERASIILMHMKGTPGTMQEAPVYQDCVSEVLEFLQERVEAAVRMGIPRERIAVDPGVGFGKRLEDNLSLLKNLNRFHETGCAVVLGVSRKSFIGLLTKAKVEDRLAGSVAAALMGWMKGADVLRVHDVAETRQALQVAAAIQGVRS